MEGKGGRGRGGECLGGEKSRAEGRGRMCGFFSFLFFVLFGWWEKDVG